ncbi:MAG: phosphoribosylaminoimidazolesuccinocarboxamide synthase [Candidatus Paceibacterota bacterium]|jgi:phosphoribosylaminoimidazole-succinocarboxamide synthase
MEKGKELYRGKTKGAFAVDDPTALVLQNYDALTKFDTPELTAQMANKAIYATKTTCNVFNLLKAAGLPVAFREQLSETEFLVDKCQMIPLEVIARRYAVGSYLNRVPELKAEDGQPPHCFGRLVFELFLKTTGKIIKSFDGREIGKVPVEDPLIDLSLGADYWKLRHPKLPYSEFASDLGITVYPTDIVPGGEDILPQIEEITRKVFLILEGAWAQLECRLIDFKIEFGITTDGRLVVADVIDNDSWRLRTNNWEELSKQLFRDNVSMEEISSKYQLVAELSEHFDAFEAVEYMDSMK